MNAPSSGAIKTYSIGVLLFAQLVPTFGGFIGSPGNGIPLSVALIGFLGVFMIYFTGGISRNFFYQTTLYLTIVTALFTLSNLISPFGQVLRDLSIYVKIFAIYFTFMCGYLYLTRTSDFKTLFKVNLLILGFHILLYIDHLFDPNGPIQNLYHYKALVGGYGGYNVNRFPGTWNFPYNESVFLFSSAVILLYGCTRSGLIKGLSFFLIACITLYISMFGTQSRSGFISVFLCGAYGVGLYGMIGLAKNRSKSLTYAFMWVFATIFGAILFLNLVQAESIFENFSHLSKLLDENDTSAYKRLDEMKHIVTNYFEPYPLNFIFGFGGARGEGIYVESFLNYVFNYGLVGLFLIVGPWVYLWFMTLSYAFTVKERHVSTGFLMANVVIIYMFLIGTSADIFLHFRFIPYYYFFVGVAVKYMHILRYERRFDTKNNLGYYSYNQRPQSI